VAYVEKLLAPEERVVYRTRRHGIVLARGVAGALVLGGLGVGALFFFGVIGAGREGAAVGTWVGVGAAALAALVALPSWLRFRAEEYLVTDRRVLQSEGVLAKRVLDSSLDKVNDVLLEQSLVGRLLGYGDLQILTASEQGINRLDTIPDPLAFKRAMLSVKSRPAGAPVPDAAARLAELEELRRRGLVSDQEYRAKRAAILERL
jgi:uncharacterized membrane protein YdbT with pleckstrin-like domain